MGNRAEEVFSIDRTNMLTIMTKYEKYPSNNTLETYFNSLNVMYIRATFYFTFLMKTRNQNLDLSLYNKLRAFESTFCTNAETTNQFATLLYMATIILRHPVYPYEVTNFLEWKLNLSITRIFFLSGC